VATPAKSAQCALNGEYVVNASIALSGATPAPGWHVASWTGTDADGSTASSNTLTMPASARVAGVNYGVNVFPYECTTGTGNEAMYSFSQITTATGFTPGPGDVLAAFTTDYVLCAV